MRFTWAFDGWYYFCPCRYPCYVFVFYYLLLLAFFTWDVFFHLQDLLPMNHLLPEMLIENFPITLHCKDLLTTQANLKLLVYLQIPPPSGFLLDQLSVPVPHKERLEEAPSNIIMNSRIDKNPGYSSSCSTLKDVYFCFLSLCSLSFYSCLRISTWLSFCLSLFCLFCLC